MNNGESVAVNYVISPLIGYSNDTDMNYNKTIYITGDNIQSSTQHIDIYVNFADVISGNMSAPEWWIKRKAFCDAFPTAPDCLTEPFVVFRDKLIYDAPPILMNISPADVKRYMDDQGGLRDDWATHANNQKSDTIVIKDGIVDIKNSQESNTQVNQENSDRIKTFSNIFYVLFGSLLFMLIGGITSTIMFIYYRKRKLHLGGIL